MHRLRLSLLTAAAWTMVETIHARRLVRAGLPRPGSIRKPPRLPDDARRAVTGVLRRTKSTCLVQSLVLQEWDAAHGRPRDVVIGVTSPAKFGAHAWLAGEGHESGSFAELIRLPPGARAPR